MAKTTGMIIVYMNWTEYEREEGYGCSQNDEGTTFHSSFETARAYKKDNEVGGPNLYWRASEPKICILLLENGSIETILEAEKTGHVVRGFIKNGVATIENS